MRCAVMRRPAPRERASASPRLQLRLDSTRLDQTRAACPPVPAPCFVSLAVPCRVPILRPFEQINSTSPPPVRPTTPPVNANNSPRVSRHTGHTPRSIPSVGPAISSRSRVPGWTVGGAIMINRLAASPFSGVHVSLYFFHADPSRVRACSVCLPETRSPATQVS